MKNENLRLTFNFMYHLPGNDEMNGAIKKNRHRRRRYEAGKRRQNFEELLDEGDENIKVGATKEHDSRQKADKDGFADDKKRAGKPRKLVSFIVFSFSLFWQTSQAKGGRWQGDRRGENNKPLTIFPIPTTYSA